MQYQHEWVREGLGSFRCELILGGSKGMAGGKGSKSSLIPVPHRQAPAFLGDVGT